MGRVRKLAKNTLILTIGRMSTQLITFLLLPLYTGLLSTEEYGIVDLVNTLVMVCIPVISLQVDQGAFRMLVDNRESDEGKCSVVTNAMVLVLLCSAVFLLIGIPVALYVNMSQWFFLICIVIATVCTNMLLQVARGIDKTGDYAFASFIISLSTIVFNVVFLAVLKLGANGMLLGTFLGHAVGCTYLLLRLRLNRYLRFSLISKRTICSLLGFSAPLVPSSISWWIFNASDRVITTAVLGLSMNGILSASTKFSGAFIAVYNIFVLSWTESICEHICDADIQEFFARIFNAALKIFYSAGLMLLAFIPFLYDAMINRRYQEGFGLVPLHLIASMLNIILGLLGAVYIAKKNTRTVAITSVISAAINLAVNVLSIGFIGLYSSPVSTIVALAIMVLVRNKDISNKYFVVNYDKKVLLITAICWTIILIGSYQGNVMVYVIGIIVAGAYSFYACKNMMGAIVKNIKMNWGMKKR